MSQSPETANVVATDQRTVQRYRQGWRALNRLLHEDASFSGNERHCAFLNLDGNRFASVSSTSGLDFAEDGRAVATADWDFDGDLDLWITARTAPRLRFMKNQQQTNHHFVAVRLQGNGSTTNWDAIGARLELYTKPTNTPYQIRTVYAGDAFLSQSTGWVHFGLAEQTDVDRLVVRWPGGNAETYQLPAVDRFYVVHQGEPDALVWQTPQSRAPLTTSRPHLAQEDDRARVVLPFKLPLPSLAVSHEEPSENGDDAVLVDNVSVRSGKLRLHGPALINLWSSECLPCLKELAAWSQRSDDFRKHGLSVVALNTDRLKSGNEPSANQPLIASVETVARKLQLAFPSFFAQPSAAENLDCFQRGVMDRWQTLSVPSSFLIDKDGCVTAIYRGPVDVDQLLDDMKLLKASPREKMAAALPFPGRRLFGPPSALPLMVSQQMIDRAAVGEAMHYLNDYLAFASRYYADQPLPQHIADVHYVLGVLLVEQHQRKSGFDHFRKAIKINPEDARAHNQLAELLFQARRFAEAEQHLQRVITLDPNHLTAYRKLALCLLQQGKYPQAARLLRSAVDQLGNDPLLHFHLATALRHLDDWHGTINSYQIVLEHDPNQVLAANNLAWILASHSRKTIRDPKEAVRLATKICRQTNHQQPMFLDTLSVALAADGRFEEAVHYATKALKLADDAKWPSAKRESIRQRIKLFRRQRPYREP